MIKNTKVYFKLNPNILPFLGDKKLIQAIILKTNGEIKFKKIDLGDIQAKEQIFVPIIYEKAYEILVDEENSKIKSESIIEINNEFIHLFPDMEISLIVFQSNIVRFFVEVGDYIHKNQKLAQVLSKRFRVKNIKSNINGRIVYLAQLPQKPLKNVIIIIPK